MSQNTPPSESSNAVRLLPLIEGSPNEGLANLLARLIVEKEEDAAQASWAAIVILSGIQAFLDTNGDYGTVELMWEPAIVIRNLQKTYGPKAKDVANEMAASCKQLNDERGARIYARAAVALESIN